MTAISLSQLNDVIVGIRLGTTIQDKAIMVGRVGDRFTVAYDRERVSLDGAAMLSRSWLRTMGYTVAELILEDHDPDLTALYRSCSKLRMNVEHAEGPLITEPVVKGRGEDWSYMAPKGWDLSDALGRLPSAFATARPNIARNLRRIEQARRESDGKIDQALDITASLILETGDPQGAYDELALLLGRARPESGESAA